MMRQATWLTAALLVVLPTRALAFNSPLMFKAPAVEGGGGERFFTGAPSDGFTCKVCHRGGVAPQVKVLGLPLTGYKVGRSYEVTIDWANDINHVALNVEITDDQGVAAGTLTLPPDKELQPNELCTRSDGQKATMVGGAVLSTVINRIVVAVDASCNARQVRFLWTAPPEDRGAVRITGSMVVSDESGTIDGDGVTEIARIIASRSDRDAQASTINGCSVSRPRASSPVAGAGWLLFGVLGLWLRRRRG